ncbi:MAG: hypothetical protein IPP06_06310 [Saprospiraceae bacterium]|nr:hypothetical protein [Candidatus Vicinibacter affinis]
MSTCPQSITVRDITAPVITCPIGVTINCQADTSASANLIATATDNCDAAPAITWSNSSTKGTNPEICNYYSYVITRTFVATMLVATIQVVYSL